MQSLTRARVLKFNFEGAQAKPALRETLAKKTIVMRVSMIRVAQDRV